MNGCAFRTKQGWHGCAAAFADDDYKFALAVLVLSKAAIKVIFFEVGGLHVSTELSAINLSFFAFTADDVSVHFLCHRFAQFVQKDECGFIAGVQIAAEGERALALHFIAEHGYGCEIGLQG
jgi:hypothetical protein